MKSFEDVIDMVIEEHKDNNVDAVIHTGDLFDSPHPELETVTECIDIIKKLDKYSIPFYMIVGNHERKRNKQWADLMNMIEEQVIRLSEDPIEFDNVRIYGIDAIRTPEWSTKDLTLEGDDDCFNLLCMHELVNPPVPKHMSDYSANKILERVELNIDLLALGDYHEDCIEKYNDTKIIYPGSTEKTKRSESKNHYVYLLEIDNNNELEIKRKLIEESRKNIRLV
jgi:DNA repair exonuclease SbcCD nuclease subunit